MTFEELKAEADKLGYRLVKQSSPIRLIPCTCGSNRRESWYTFDGLQFYRCSKCGKESPAGASCRDAKRKWNEMIMKEKEKLDEH